MTGHDYQGLIYEFRRSQSVDDVHAACTLLCRTLEFDAFFYAYRLPTSFVTPQFFLISSFPREWQNHYQEKNYHQIDPILLHCNSSLLPVSWSFLQNSRMKNPQIRQFFRDAARFGLKSGLSCPIFCQGMEGAVFSVATADASEKTECHIDHVTPFIHSLSYHLQEAVSRIIEIQEIEPVQALTRRERECMAWAAEGKTSWEVATILGISERTVFFHVSNAMEKLGVTSRQQAIAKALSLGVL